jgi:hypothetical protein
MLEDGNATQYRLTKRGDAMAKGRSGVLEKYT